MKKRISTIALIAVFLIGFSVLLYPTVADFINSQNQSRAIAGYQERVDALRTEDYEAILAQAREYNAHLTYNDFSVPDEASDTAGYRSLLSVEGSDLMGYLEIEKIDVKLGIYHGINEGTLQIGVGHLPQTALPIGGEGTHSVLSGHTGLPSSTLLTNLDQVEIGDIFKIRILNEVYAYQVDQIVIVEPNDLAYLATEPGKDFLTIVTCTPYGVNSHRLLVRGSAIDLEEEDYGPIVSDAQVMDPFIIAPFYIIPILILMLIVIIIYSRRSRKKNP